MFRKLAGSSLALVLVAIVAMKHVALAFCLCEAQVVTDRAGCCADHEVTPACCCEETTDPAPDPCRNCMVEIDTGTKEFLWSAAEFTPPEEVGTPVKVPTGDLAPIPYGPVIPATAVPARGSPPGLPPLYIRQSVLRL